MHLSVYTRLSYCKGVFAGLDLKMIQNDAAQVLTKAKKWDQTPQVLRSLVDIFKKVISK